MTRIPETLTDRTFLTGAFVIIALALVLRALFFVGYQGQDDRNYLSYAHHVASGGSVTTLGVHTQWVGRLGFWIPVAASMRILGNTEIGYVAYPLLCSVIGILVTLYLGAHTVGRRAALVGSFIVAVLPLDILYSTRAYPDVPVGVFMVAWFALAIISRSSQRPLLMAGCAGLLAGFAYLHKETAVFGFLPVCIALRWWDRRQWPAATAMMGAFILVLAVEGTFWFAVSGDPLYRFHSTKTALTEQSTALMTRGTAGGLIPGPLPDQRFRSENSLMDAALMLFTNEEFGVFTWLLLLALIVAFLNADRPTRDLRLWIVTLLTLMLFLPVVQWPRYTMPRDPRYLTCLTIPAALVLAYYFTRLRRMWRGVLLGGFLGSSLLGAYLGQQSSLMEPQRTLLSDYSSTPDRLWVTSQLAADMLMMSGMVAPPSLGIHLLEQGRTANSFQAAMLVSPDLPVLDSPSGGTSDVLVIRTQNQERVPAGWSAFATLQPQPSPLIQRAQQLLRAMGLDVFARRLAPSAGNGAVLFRFGAP